MSSSAAAELAAPAETFLESVAHQYDTITHTNRIPAAALDVFGALLAGADLLAGAAEVTAVIAGAALVAAGAALVNIKSYHDYKCTLLCSSKSCC